MPKLNRYIITASMWFNAYLRGDKEQYDGLNNELNKMEGKPPIPHVEEKLEEQRKNQPGLLEKIQKKEEDGKNI